AAMPSPPSDVAGPAPASPSAVAPRSGPFAATGVSTRPERLARAKRFEARFLRAGAEATLPSAVTVVCATRGFRDAVGRQAAVGGNATAVVVAEAARLLRKYPAFNAYHDDGTLH